MQIHKYVLYLKALNLKYVSFTHFTRQCNNIKAPAIWIYNSFISYFCAHLCSTSVIVQLYMVEYVDIGKVKTRTTK